MKTKKVFFAIICIIFAVLETTCSIFAEETDSWTREVSTGTISLELKGVAKDESKDQQIEASAMISMTIDFELRPTITVISSKRFPYTFQSGSIVYEVTMREQGRGVTL